MGKLVKRVVCTHCFVGDERELKQSFLGFYNFQCERCQTTNTYPLSQTYVAIYVIAIVIFIASTLGAIAGQSRASCGILGIGGIVALAYDIGIRRRAREAEQRERK